MEIVCALVVVRRADAILQTAYVPSVVSGVAVIAVIVDVRFVTRAAIVTVENVDARSVTPRGMGNGT